MPSQRRSAAASATPPDTDAAASGPVRVLKKYPNRRLYDTRTSSYITLSDVKQMVLGGEHFEVRDAKTGDELTRSILLQIILEEETGGMPMFTTQMLAQVIRFYGHAMQGMMGSYLEGNLQAFVDMQTRIAEQSKGLYDPKSFTPEMWTQFMAGPSPLLPGVMGTYLEQSQNLFAQMQEKVQEQLKSGGLFPIPGLTPKR
jgi:polyhydroxyalkanoate synthesis repressor PhaR